MDIVLEIDARNLLCPLPVLRLRKRLQSVASGGCVKIITTDPAAIVDIPHFCVEAGHALLDSTSTDAETHWVIRKA